MQITENVHALRIPFKIQLNPTTILDRFVYCYLVYGDEVCLIDTGIASTEKIILEYLKKSGRDFEEITLIVQTHAHPDHIGATKVIKERTGCRVAIHEAEKVWIENVDSQFIDRPVPGFHQLVGGSVRVDEAFSDGKKFDLGKGMEIEMVHTPGHSPGSTSIWLKKEGILFTGDSVPLLGDMPIYDDAMASIKSLEKIRRMNGILTLLGSWDAPRQGEEVQTILTNGLDYLNLIHLTIKNALEEEPTLSDPVLCRRVLNELGLVNAPAMPLIMRSFRSNREWLRS